MLDANGHLNTRNKRKQNLMAGVKNLNLDEASEALLECWKESELSQPEFLRRFLNEKWGASLVEGQVENLFDGAEHPFAERGNKNDRIGDITIIIDNIIKNNVEIEWTKYNKNTDEFKIDVDEYGIKYDFIAKIVHMLLNRYMDSDGDVLQYLLRQVEEIAFKPSIDEAAATSALHTLEFLSRTLAEKHPGAVQIIRNSMLEGGIPLPKHSIFQAPDLETAEEGIDLVDRFEQSHSAQGLVETTSVKSIDSVVAEILGRLSITWSEETKKTKEEGRRSPAQFIREEFKDELSSGKLQRSMLASIDFPLSKAYASWIRPSRHPEDSLWPDVDNLKTSKPKTSEEEKREQARKRGKRYRDRKLSPTRN